SWIGANNLVPFNNGRDTNPGRAAFRRFVHANHFTHGANENFGTPRDFRWKRQSNIQFSPCAEVLIDGEVKAARGNVTRLSVARGSVLIDRYPNYDGQVKIVPTC